LPQGTFQQHGLSVSNKLAWCLKQAGVLALTHFLQLHHACNALQTSVVSNAHVPERLLVGAVQQA